MKCVLCGLVGTPFFWWYRWHKNEEYDAMHETLKDKAARCCKDRSTHYDYFNNYVEKERAGQALNISLDEFPENVKKLQQDHETCETQRAKRVDERDICQNKLSETEENLNKWFEKANHWSAVWNCSVDVSPDVMSTFKHQLQNDHVLCQKEVALHANELNACLANCTTQAEELDKWQKKWSSKDQACQDSLNISLDRLPEAILAQRFFEGNQHQFYEEHFGFGIPLSKLPQEHSKLKREHDNCLNSNTELNRQLMGFNQCSKDLKNSEEQLTKKSQKIKSHKATAKRLGRQLEEQKKIETENREIFQSQAQLLFSFLVGIVATVVVSVMGCLYTVDVRLWVDNNSAQRRARFMGASHAPEPLAQPELHVQPHAQPEAVPGGDLEECKRQNNELEAFRADVEKQKEALDAQKEALDEQKEALDEQKEELDAQKEALDAQKEALDEQKEALDEQKEALDEQKEELDEQKEALDEQKQALDEQKQALDEQQQKVTCMECSPRQVMAWDCLCQQADLESQKAFFGELHVSEDLASEEESSSTQGTTREAGAEAQVPSFGSAGGSMEVKHSTAESSEWSQQTHRVLCLVLHMCQCGWGLLWYRKSLLKVCPPEKHRYCRHGGPHRFVRENPIITEDKTMKVESAHTGDSGGMSGAAAARCGSFSGGEVAMHAATTAAEDSQGVVSRTAKCHMEEFCCPCGARIIFTATKQKFVTGKCETFEMNYGDAHWPCDLHPDEQSTAGADEIPAGAEHPGAHCSNALCALVQSESPGLS